MAIIVPTHVRTRWLLPARIGPAPARSRDTIRSVGLPTADVQTLKILLKAIVDRLLQAVKVKKLILRVARIGHGAITVWRDVARGL